MNFHIMNLWYLLEMVWEILQDVPDHETGTCKSSILQLTIIISQHDVQSQCYKLLSHREHLSRLQQSQAQGKRSYPSTQPENSVPVLRG